MCGICGVIDWTASGGAAAIVRRMTPTMLHRGPDDEGYLEVGTSDIRFRKSNLGEKLSIGMRRLSIIDLEGGHQPILNEDGRVAAVLNGEIYNFLELRMQLEDRGHTFGTRSDSEVVVHAYEEWGAECVERFQGMFAIAVWDGRGAKDEEQSGTLFLARDRLGIKPLYYYVQVQSPMSNVQSLPFQEGPWARFVFASEVRTLLASGVVPRQLSRGALESYLLFGSVSEPMTLVDGVLSLPPGHRMTIDLRPSHIAPRPEAYWTITAKNSEASNHSSGNGRAGKPDLESAAVRVRALLEASVQKHLIADVPVGVFLSGGVDSTALAALASREAAGVHTFTVVFPEREFSEAAISRRTAAQYGTTHQEVMLSGDEMVAQMSQAVGALDQPSMDGINTYFVSGAARQAGLKVTLSGLGGDEVFGGYNTFRRTPGLEWIGAVGGHVPGRVRSVVASMAGGAAAGSRARGDAVRKVTALWNDRESLPHPYFFGRAVFTPPQVAGLMNEMNGTNDSLWWRWLANSAAQAKSFDPFTAVTCMESQSYLVNTLLRDTDSMSMAHSLEVRVPFLDHPLVEFVTQLPQEVKLRKGATKALLLAALADLLPSEVTEQPKRGFTFPWANWLRGPLKENLDEGFREFAPALGEALDAGKAKGIWQDYLDGKTSWSRPWSLYVLNEWIKKHLS